MHATSGDLRHVFIRNGLGPFLSTTQNTSELSILSCEKFVYLLVLGHRVDNNILRKSDAISLIKPDRQEIIAKVLLIEAIKSNEDWLVYDGQARTIQLPIICASSPLTCLVQYRLYRPLQARSEKNLV